MSERARLALLLLTVGLLVAVVGIHPTFAAEFSEDTMMRVDDVEPGMTGYGKTVFEGTQVDTFAVKVEGVLEDVMPGQDLILVSSDAPVLQGPMIIAGMSGSPIYLNDKLVGALGYSWGFQRRPIAAITPIENILRDRRVGEPSREMAGLQSITMPVVASGMTPEARQEIEDVLSDHLAGPFELQTGGQGSSSPVEGAELKPGAPVGVQLMRGDLSLTSMGTVTHVAGDEIYLFGHPFMRGGEVEFPMTKGVVHTIMPSYSSSFKLASPGAAVGSVREDRQASVVGELGGTPEMLPVSIRLRVPEENYEETYQVEVIRDRNLTPGLVGSAVLNFASTELGQLGTNRVNTSVNVSLPDRRDLSYRTTTVSPQSVDIRALQPLLELWNNPFGDFQPDSIEFDMELVKQDERAAIERAWLDRSTVRPGETVTVHVSFQPFRETPRVESYPIEIPSDIPPEISRLTIVSAEQLIQLQPQPRSVEDLIRRTNRLHGADELAFVLEYPGASVERDGQRMEGLPRSMAGIITEGTDSIERHVETARTPWVVQGSTQLELDIRHP